MQGVIILKDVKRSELLNVLYFGILLGCYMNLGRRGQCLRKLMLP